MGMRNMARLLMAALINSERFDLRSTDVMYILPETDDTGALNIGNGTYDMDAKWFGGATTKYVLFDKGNALLQLEDVDMLAGDNDSVTFGDGNDVIMVWDGTYFKSSSGMYADYPSPADPNMTVKVHEFFDDFNTIDATNDWTETVVGTGTQALSGTNSSLLLTCQATTDNACEQVEWARGECFLLAAGKTLWYEVYLRITGDVQSEHAFGLFASEDLTAVADVKPADGIAFTTQDASLALTLTASKDGTNTGESAGVHTLVTATWVRLGFLVDGLTSITPYVNGVAGTAISATFCDDEELTPFFLVRNGDETTTQIMEIDYVRVAQLR